MSYHRTKTERGQGCRYLSMGMTDWNFFLIASSLLRADRNLGTQPTKQETIFETHSNILWVLAWARWVDFTLAIQTRAKAGRVNDCRKKKGNDGDFISVLALFQFIQITCKLSCDSFEFGNFIIFLTRVVKIFIWRQSELPVFSEHYQVP